jgi:hypothetical protein
MASAYGPRHNGAKRPDFSFKCSQACSFRFNVHVVALFWNEIVHRAMIVMAAITYRPPEEKL